MEFQVGDAVRFIFHPIVDIKHGASYFGAHYNDIGIITSINSSTIHVQLEHRGIYLDKAWITKQDITNRGQIYCLIK